MKGLNDGPYNVAVFLIPTVPDEGLFMACPAESATVVGDIEDLPAILPVDWNGRVHPRLWDIEKVIVDMEANPDIALASNTRDLYAEEGVSHVALLESDLVRDGSRPFKFGGHDIRGNSVMVLYSADRNKYRLFHCFSCAYAFSKWLEGKQVDAADQGFQKGGKSLH